jgi:4-amino-4-deoxy-L-arabinose transferase-like glycosyltransferase
VIDLDTLRRHFFWLFPLSLFVAFFLQLGVPPLFDLDEGAFSSASWEMLQRQDFITVYSNGDLRFDKPILIYWLQSASVYLFGITEWAFRLPSAIAAVLWASAVYYFVRQREYKQVDGNVIAAIASLLLINAFMVVIVGRAAIADAVLNLLIVLSLFDIYRYFEYKQAPRWLVYRVYLWMGLGLLCKGPIAVFVPFAASLLFAFWDKRLMYWLKAIISPIGWVIMLVVALPWYLLEYQAQGQLFIDGFFLKHNVGRFTDTMESHGGSIFYYFPVVLLVIMPFGGWLLQLVFKLLHTINEPLDRFLWSWFIVVFVFFSFSSTQLPQYLLYGTTPLLILLARHHKHFNWRWLSFLPPVAFASILVFLPELLNEAANNAKDDAYIQALYAYSTSIFTEQYQLYAALFAGVTVFLAVFIWIQCSVALLLAGIAQTVFLVMVLIPAVAHLQQQPVKEAGLYAKEHLSEETIITWHINMPSFVVYREKISPKGEPSRGDIVYTRIDKLPELGKHELLFSKGGIVLARKQ